MRYFPFEARPRHFAHRFPGYRDTHRLFSQLAGCLAVCFGVAGCAVSEAPPPQKTVAAPPKKTISIPRPPAKLLAREPAPKCTYADEEPAAAATRNVEGNGGNSAESSPSIDRLTESLNRRERERDCFRDAEYRVRTKLTKLQTSVRETLRAVDELSKSSEQ